MIGTILLSKDNKYLDKDGKLPARPRRDKDILKVIASQGIISADGAAILPDSIIDASVNRESKFVPITIQELAEADILLVNRSCEYCMDSKSEFRLDNYERLESCEVWIKKVL